MEPPEAFEFEFDGGVIVVTRNGRQPIRLSTVADNSQGACRYADQASVCNSLLLDLNQPLGRNAFKPNPRPKSTSQCRVATRIWPPSLPLETGANVA